MSFSFQAYQPTWPCHWFPAQSNQRGKLYDVGGPLQKYDRAFGTKSQGYEVRYNSVSASAGAAYSWFGHCTQAAMVVSLFREPKKSVVFNGVRFTPYDIKGLLVKIVESVPAKIEGVGQRYPQGPLSDPDPRKMMTVLRAWANDPYAIIMDIDRSTPVWNYAYDRFRWTQNQQGIGEVLFTSTGAPDKTKRYRFNVRTNQWLTDNPDFCWRVIPKVDLTKRESYTVKNTFARSYLNPLISPRNVFELYSRSAGLV